MATRHSNVVTLKIETEDGVRGLGAGALHPGEAPGLGVDIDEARAAEHPYDAAYLPTARTLDGTVHSW